MKLHWKNYFQRINMKIEEIYSRIPYDEWAVKKLLEEANSLRAELGDAYHDIVGNDFLAYTMSYLYEAIEEIVEEYYSEQEELFPESYWNLACLCGLARVVLNGNGF